MPIVNSRFLQGHKDISSEVVQDARRVLNSPTDALRPGYYAKGAPCLREHRQWCMRPCCCAEQLSLGRPASDSTTQWHVQLQTLGRQGHCKQLLLSYWYLIC